MDSEPLHPILSLAELRTTAPEKTSWLWEDLVAAGNVTLLTAQWKAGKTTLLSILLSKLRAGGELAGRPVAAARAVIVSEEPPEQWVRRAETLDFAEHVGWICRPFLYRPRLSQWLRLLEQLADRCRDEPHLVVIDPLAAFLPGSENHAAAVLDALMPFKRLTEKGAAVLLLHHVRKGRTLIGQAARGSGALAGQVDIEIAMSGPPANDLSDRRRRLQVFSRFGLHACAIELNAEGSDYGVCEAEPMDEPLAAGWEEIREVLDDAPHKVTREELRCRWPDGCRPPAAKTLWRLLDQAVARGLVYRDGTGKRNDPHCFWLPGKVEEWLANPLGQMVYEMAEQDRERRRRGELPPLSGMGRREESPWEEENED